MAASIGIAVTRSDLQIAPEAVTFMVTSYDGFDTPGPKGVFDQRFHDLIFLWDFGDPGATHSLPVNLPQQHRDANRGYGPEVAHVYGPGTYTVSVRVIEPSSGKTAEWSGTFTVKDPARAFKASEIIYVDPEGRFARAPREATRVRGLNGAGQAMDVLSRSRGKRWIQLRGDVRHYVTDSIVFATRKDPSRGWPNIYVSPEPGHSGQAVVGVIDRPYQRPIFEFWDLTTALPSGQIDMVWKDIRFAGPWDSRTESGGPSHTCFQMTGSAIPTYMLWTGCEFTGWGMTFNSWISSNITLHDTRITNWRDYGFFGGVNSMAVLGSSICPDVDAISGGNKDGRHNNHGPIRMHISPHMIMDGSELFSRHGWFPNIPGYVTQQPCLRFGMQGEDARGSRLNMQRCSLEGGYPPVVIAETGGSALTNVNVRIERSILLGSHMSYSLIDTAYGGVTVRNNLLIHPDVPRLNGIYNPIYFVGARNRLAKTGQEFDRVLVEQNTMVNLMSEGSYAGRPPTAELLATDPAYPHGRLSENNNLIHEPNLGTPNTPYAPLDTTPLSFTPREKGYLRRMEVVHGTLGRSVAPGDNLHLSYPVGTIESWFDKDGTRSISLGEAGIWLGASGITVTNRSGKTWESGKRFSLLIERQVAHMFPRETERATPPASLASYAPKAGSRALGASSNEEADDDFFGETRPAYASIGAFESSD